MNFRLEQQAVPLAWTSHWRYQFSIRWVGPDNMLIRQSPLTLLERLTLQGEITAWATEQFGEPDMYGAGRWFFNNKLGCVFLKDGDDAFAFKVRFG